MKRLPNIHRDAWLESWWVGRSLAGRCGSVVKGVHSTENSTGKDPIARSSIYRSSIISLVLVPRKTSFPALMGD